jgi:hypothetical protein
MPRRELTFGHETRLAATADSRLRFTTEVDQRSLTNRCSALLSLLLFFDLFYHQGTMPHAGTNSQAWTADDKWFAIDHARVREETR